MIYLVRHGLDDENYIGGWSDVDLTSTGYKQIEETSKFIVDKGLVINKIISSDVKRAVTSANIIDKKLKLGVEISKDLRELDKGDYTGLLKSKLSSQEQTRINEFTIYDKYPNGESMLDLYKRIQLYLTKIKKFDNTLLVTHRGVINMFYYLLNDIEPSMDKGIFNVVHGSVHEMDINKRLIRRIY